MAKTMNVLLAGFGGQGILFAGKTIAYSALMDGKELSSPDVLVAMNLPSLDKFVNAVVPGGTILVDSSMINKKVERTDVNVYYVDATKIADENNMHSCAIIILIGKMFKELGFCSKEALDAGIRKCIPAKKAAMLDLNLKALEIGQNS